MFANFHRLIEFYDLPKMSFHETLYAWSMLLLKKKSSKYCSKKFLKKSCQKMLLEKKSKSC